MLLDDHSTDKPLKQKQMLLRRLGIISVWICFSGAINVLYVCNCCDNDWTDWSDWVVCWHYVRFSTLVHALNVFFFSLGFLIVTFSMKIKIELRVFVLNLPHIMKCDQANKKYNLFRIYLCCLQNWKSTFEEDGFPFHRYVLVCESTETWLRKNLFLIISFFMNLKRNIIQTFCVLFTH